MSPPPVVVLVLDWPEAVRYAVFLHPWGISEEVEAFNMKSRTLAFVHLFTQSGKVLR